MIFYFLETSEFYMSKIIEKAHTKQHFTHSDIPDTIKTIPNASSQTISKIDIRI